MHGRRDLRRLWLLIALLLAVPAAAAQPHAQGAAAATRAGRQLASDLMARLSNARRRGKRLESRCLDTLLTQANSLRAQVDYQLEALARARRVADRAAQARARAKLTHLAERAQTLGRQASHCETTRVADVTRVTATIPTAPRHEPAKM